MLEHVWRRTTLSDVDETYIAVCDKETIEVCKKIGAKYIVTLVKNTKCVWIESLKLQIKKNQKLL